MRAQQSWAQHEGESAVVMGSIIGAEGEGESAAATTGAEGEGESAAVMGSIIGAEGEGESAAVMGSTIESAVVLTQ